MLASWPEMATRNDIALAFSAAFGILCATAGLILAWRLPTPRQILEKWLCDNGLTLEQAQRRTWRRGPFSQFLFHSTGNQVVFRITVRDADKHILGGFARIGGFFGLGNHVKIFWDGDGGPAD